jgi:exosortase
MVHEVLSTREFMSTSVTLPAARPASPAQSSGFWKIGVIAALVGILYAYVLADLANDWWTDESLSYGLLVPPMALYVAWLRRDITLREPVAPDNRGLWLVALACLVYTLGKFGAEFFLPRISFVFLLAGLVWTFWGIARLRTLLFPFFLLATMVPLPVIVYNAVAAPLQLLASDAATRIAQLVGVSVYRDGNVIQLANLSLGVEEACSGLNSLSSLIVGSVLLGFLKLTRPLTRLALFALTIPLAIAVNIIRVTGTAIIADYTREIAQGFYHMFSGWLVFVLGFGAQYLLTLALARWCEPRRIS